ncbi:MAG: hypothetical protein Q4F00_07305 [bacterium]|nr:hypothetical protein [bacterium]
MNSINCNNPLNSLSLQTVTAERPQTGEEVPQAAGDSVEIGADSPAAGDESSVQAPQEFKKMRLRDIPKDIKEGKKPDQTLVKFAVQHPKGVAIAAGIAGVAVATLGGALVAGAGNNLGEVIDVVKSAASMSTVKEKAEVFKQAAHLVGVQAAAGAVVGAGGLGIAAVLDGVKGTQNLVKGAKKGDKLKMARGARKMNVGFKGALAAGTVASYGIANAPGPVGAFRSGIMPGLKVATAALNTTVGAIQLAKGINTKNKKDIIGGALNLGVGVAAGVSMAMGGGIVATACTVFTAARSGFNAINNAIKLHKYAKEARAEMKGQMPDAKAAEGKDKAGAADSAQAGETKSAADTTSGVQSVKDNTPVAENNADKRAEKTETPQETANLERLLNSSPEDAIWIDG